MTYNPAGGGASGAWTFIETITVSNQATVDFDLTGSHSVYVLHIDNLVPVTDGDYLWSRFSVDGGSTFLSGASDYAWTQRGQFPTLTTESSAADTHIQMTNDGNGSFQNMGNASAESLNGFVYIHNAKQSTKAVHLTAQVAMLAEDNNLALPLVRGALIANIDEVDAIQFLTDNGNLNTGRISLYGIDSS